MDIYEQNKLHDIARAYHDKKVSDDYVKGRPTYPLDILELLKTEIGLTVDSVLVDLAAGTGKFTEMLINSGFKNVTAVEPSPEFREQITKIIETKSNVDGANYKVVEGFASNLPLSDNSVDCITIAQAFHWFANIDTIKEINRVLKPNGVLFLLWNRLDEELNPEVSETIALFKKSYSNANSPKFETQNWRSIFEEIKSNESLQTLIDPNLKCQTFVNPQMTNYEKSIANILSISFISLLPKEKKDSLISALQNKFQSYEKTKDNKDFILNYKTETFYTRKPQL